MRRIIIASLFLVMSSPAWAQCATQKTPGFTAPGNVFGYIASQWNQFFGNKVDLNNGCANALNLVNPTINGVPQTGVTSPTIMGNNSGATAQPFALTPGQVQAMIGSASQVATNAALEATSTGTYPNGVWRATFSVNSYANANAPPLFYVPSASACSLNAGAGDNGSQVESADGKCWIARFPSGPLDIRQFGAIGDSSTDNTAAIQNALNAAKNQTDGGGGANAAIYVPGIYRYFCIYTPGGVTAQDTSIIGDNFQSSFLSTCEHDVKMLTLSGAGVMQNVFLCGAGYGCAATSLDVAQVTQPLIYMDGSNGYCLEHVNAVGGYYNVNARIANGDMCVRKSGFAYSYGDGLFLQNSEGYFENNFFDDSVIPTITGCSPETQPIPSAWAATTAYAKCQMAVLNGWYIEAAVAGTSGGTAPTLTNYRTLMNDGSVQWALVSPFETADVHLDSGSNQNYFTNNDYSATYSYGTEITNSLSAAQGPFLNVWNDDNFGGIEKTFLVNTAVNGVTITNSNLNPTWFLGETNFLTANGPSTNIILNTDLIYQGGSYGAVINDASTNLNFSNDQFGGETADGILINAAATAFVIGQDDFAGNAFTGTNSGSVSVGAFAADYYNIVNNITHGLAVSDSGTGTHKTLWGNN